MSISDFYVVSTIGASSNSKMLKVKRKSDDQTYALKKINLQELDEKERASAINEVRILASLRHPNLICFKETFITEPANTLCIVMDYAEQGDLLQKVLDYQKKGVFMSEREIWSIFIQAAKGLKHLHDKRVLHRDLKTANLFLFNDGSVKIGDLNLSKISKKGYLYTEISTSYYVSPEIWLGRPFTIKSDIWSLGCILYEMTALKPPFLGDNLHKLSADIQRGMYQPDK